MKMTDEEIIETLERCSKGDGCFGCAKAYMHSANCIRILEAECLDLINRQKAEIERLKGSTVVNNIMESQRIKREAKTEAYKEFAEKLKDAFPECNRDCKCPAIYFDDYCYIIDECCEEMVGEEE